MCVEVRIICPACEEATGEVSLLRCRLGTAGPCTAEPETGERTMPRQRLARWNCPTNGCKLSHREEERMEEELNSMVNEAEAEDEAMDIISEGEVVEVVEPSVATVEDTGNSSDASDDLVTVRPKTTREAFQRYDIDLEDLPGRVSGRIRDLQGIIDQEIQDEPNVKPYKPWLRSEDEMLTFLRMNRYGFQQISRDFLTRRPVTALHQRAAVLKKKKKALGIRVRQRR
ncbi:hypothetical protein B0T17DRAFT_274043 [Bombardia bombarda]|uniref:Uncharacterized protein n=1 Tax=Bombardia bombarda TaxID=252184 RepID=A0AA39X1E3_9PEZI|nr:hypothetical protein B0T17DRAFT_274043 [Bombardia bombarda]